MAVWKEAVERQSILSSVALEGTSILAIFTAISFEKTT
jgi:hypothetical protein